jgi:fermentation-respiration switch protein FrsA (DUF1100 family)
MTPLRLVALCLIVLLLLPVLGLAGCQRSLLYFPRSEVVAPELPGVEAVRIETADDERLVAWHMPPPEGGPVFLFFDGNGGRPEAWERRWARIAEGGAGFLAVYYRGYSGSTGRPSETGLHLDARAGYDWLIARGYKPGDIVIHGLSLGTGVAVRLASERPARALILEAPFTAAVDVAQLRFPVLPVGLIMRDQFRSRDWIGDVNMPVLIGHGDADTVIPFEHGQRLYELANEPKRFVRMQGSDHVTLTRDGFYEHIWAFLAEHPGDSDDQDSAQNHQDQGVSR